MAAQMLPALRSARVDAIETYGGVTCALKVFTGAQPAATTDANSGTDLVTMNLPASWMAAAAAGVAAKDGVWSGVAGAGAAATPGHFRIYTSQAVMDGTTCFLQGSAAIGSGDISFNGTITSGQTVTISTFGLTDANA
jgi:hypothetical protein